MSFTNYLEQKVLDYVFGSSSFTPSGTYYIALSTTTPTESGTNFTEPASASGYSRVSITNDKSNWSTASQLAGSSSGEIHNLGVVTFPDAVGNWGTIVSFGIYDQSTSGNLLIQAPATFSKTVSLGDTPRFPSGSISIRLD